VESVALPLCLETGLISEERYLG